MFEKFFKKEGFKTPEASNEDNVVGLSKTKEQMEEAAEKYMEENPKGVIFEEVETEPAEITGNFPNEALTAEDRKVIEKEEHREAA